MYYNNLILNALLPLHFYCPWYFGMRCWWFPSTVTCKSCPVEAAPGNHVPVPSASSDVISDAALLICDQHSMVSVWRERARARAAGLSWAATVDSRVMDGGDARWVACSGRWAGPPARERFVPATLDSVPSRVSRASPPTAGRRRGRFRPAWCNNRRMVVQQLAGK